MAQKNSSHVAICNHCNGNGYLRESNGSYTEVHQCPTCKSQGEIKITNPTFEELEKMANIARLQWEESVAFPNYGRSIRIIS